MLSRAGEELPGHAGLDVRGVVAVREVEEGLVAGPCQVVDLVLLILAGSRRVEEFRLE
jgi:hypothetical protein